MSIASFYRTDRWGSRWGVVDAFHPTPHKGLDVAQNMGGSEVPNLWAGTVVAVDASASVGHYVTVRRNSDGKYVTYCHIVPYKFGANAKVKAGQALGIQARNKIEGGNAWTGPHTHLCLSTTVSGWATWGRANLDPTSDLRALLGSGAAGIGEATLIEETHVEENEMAARYALAGSDPRLFILAGDSPGTSANWLEATDPAVATGWLPVNNDGVPVGGFVDISRGTYDQWKPRYLEPVRVSGLTLGDVVVGADPEVKALLTELIAATKALNPPG